MPATNRVDSLLRGLIALPTALLLAAPALADVPVTATPATALETVVVDYGLRLSLTGVPESCRLLRVALLRRDELRPGYGAFTRAVRLDKELGRVVSLELGSEFQPHHYAAGDIRLGCYDASARLVREFVSSTALPFKAPSLSLEISKAFADAPPP